MQSFLLRIILVICLGWAGLAGLFAQEKEQKLRFNGLGRTNLLNTKLGGEIANSDTTNGKRISDGEFLLDLAINATPNKKTEVQTILRLRNEFGGFFGAGMSVEVREIWARGIIANTIRYNIGDIDLVQTPYTLFNPDEEGTVNEPEIFKAQKEIIHYENFYKEGNTRRLQGAKIDFALKSSKIIDDIEFKAYITRVRGTDFFTVPNRFVGGGKVKFIEDKYGFIGLNYVNTFDDLSVGAITTGIRNSVYSVDGKINLFENSKLDVKLMGEAGMSSLRQKVDSIDLVDKDDTFMEIGASVKIKPANLKVDISFRDIGPDFFNTAAQSKRVDFNRDKIYFNRIGNERFVRNPALFELSRDPQLYTFQLSDQLMAYDLRLSNALPYGKATPNRRGINVGIQYAAVRLKAEDIADATKSVETEAMTTVANTWETLEFDFSNEVTGTAALDLTTVYGKASIFFNFGADGNTAGDKTYYWDDVEFGSSTVAIVDLKDMGLVYYPNPVQNMLTLRADSRIDEFTLFNQMGQQIMKKVSNNSEEIVDMSSLSPGIYLVRVVIGEVSGTFRVLKN